MTALFRLDVMS